MELPGTTVVERLTLVSQVGSLHLEPPVFLQPGEVFWVQGRTLHVRAVDGEERRVPARPHRADDVR